VAVGHDAAAESITTVRAAWRKMSSTYAAAAGLPAGEEYDIALHDLRKRAKRARYAAEAAADVLGAPASKAAAHVGQLQDILGVLHDSIIARQRLRQFAEKRTTTKADAFTLGRLAGMEHCQAVRTLHELPAAWRRAIEFSP
jgi:CHAD domain-containing protein